MSISFSPNSNLSFGLKINTSADKEYKNLETKCNVNGEKDFYHLLGEQAKIKKYLGDKFVLDFEEDCGPAGEKDERKFFVATPNFTHIQFLELPEDKPVADLQDVKDGIVKLKKKI